nr:cadmium-induced protein AS8 isoform X2 [Tanacetum cinerariifolium]
MTEKTFAPEKFTCTDMRRRNVRSFQFEVFLSGNDDIPTNSFSQIRHFHFRKDLVKNETQSPVDKTQPHKHNNSVGFCCSVDSATVGITLAGVGVGLPANRLLKVPFSAVMATRSGAMDFARSSGLVGATSINGGVDVSGIQRWVSSFNHEQSADNKVTFSGINRLMSSQAKFVLDCFDGLKRHINHPR